MELHPTTEIMTQYLLPTQVQVVYSIVKNGHKSSITTVYQHYHETIHSIYVYVWYTVNDLY